MAASSVEFNHNQEFTCPVCLNILQEPFLTECCGQHLCADCVANVKRRFNECPVCRHEPLNGMIDKHFRRRLNDKLKYVIINSDGRDSVQVSSEQQTSEITEQMNSSNHSNSKQGSSEHASEVTEQVNISSHSDSVQVSSEQQTSEITEQMNTSNHSNSKQGSSEHASEVTEQVNISSHSDSEQVSSEQQSNELNVPRSPESGCDEQGSSNEQRTRDIAVIRDAERRVDNVVQLTTTVSGTGLGGVGATLGGVGIGAAIGSVVPGVGTLIGGTIGGIAGGISGVAGGTLIGYGLGKIANKLRKNPMIRDRVHFSRSTRPHN